MKTARAREKRRKAKRTNNANYQLLVPSSIQAIIIGKTEPLCGAAQHITRRICQTKGSIHALHCTDATPAGLPRTHRAVVIYKLKVIVLLNTVYSVRQSQCLALIKGWEP